MSLFGGKWSLLYKTTVVWICKTIGSVAARANFGKGNLRRRMKLAGNRFSFVKNSADLVATIIVCISLVISIAPAVLAALPQSVRPLAPADRQNLIFVWASGTASVQQQASQLSALFSALRLLANWQFHRRQLANRSSSRMFRISVGFS